MGLIELGIGIRNNHAGAPSWPMYPALFLLYELETQTGSRISEVAQNALVVENVETEDTNTNAANKSKRYFLIHTDNTLQQETLRID